MKRPAKKWIGRSVRVYWRDPSGFINHDLSDVKLSHCVSIGELVQFDSVKVILRTSKYSGSDVGDYTVLAMGCCTKFELAN